MQLAHVKELEKKYLLGTYSRYELLADRGTGAYLIDKSNKRYLDLLAGIAVNALGYNHPRIKQVLRKQIKKPIHVSNLIYHEYQGRLAEKLCKISGLDRGLSEVRARLCSSEIPRALARSVIPWPHLRCSIGDGAETVSRTI